MKYEATTRTYKMKARARSVAETGERILDAAWGRFSKMAFDDVTFNDIAEDAGVSVQTVIRRFGSKEELFTTLSERESARIRAEREPLHPDDVTMESAVEALVGHYERDGETVLNLLAQESRFPLIAAAVSAGRDAHEKWVEQHCRPILDGARGSERKRRLEAAIAATDLYVWKLLRLDRGLSRDEAEKTMLTLLEGLKRIGEGEWLES
ncbi:MAG: TetR/AcrR family transcriptional regulator [Gemmatimonadota bacterium]